MQDGTGPGAGETAAPPPAAAFPPGAVASLLESVAALGRSMHEEFDPREFLQEFSARLRPLLPHDRIVVLSVAEDRQTFSVFAEHSSAGTMLHDAYTSSFRPASRNHVSQFPVAAVFTGRQMLVEDGPNDPRLPGANQIAHRHVAAGFRAAVMSPLRAGGRVVGAISIISRTPRTYGPGHAELAQNVADLVAPLIHATVLLHRERERRRRYAAALGLLPILGASLDADETFDRLSRALASILPHDTMGAVLLDPGEARIRYVARYLDGERHASETPARGVLDYSFAPKGLGGNVVVIHDAEKELDPSMAGDREILDLGMRSSLNVPLRFADKLGGALYFGKREPHWYDALDVELAEIVGSQVVLAIQHHRLAEEQRRLAQAEVRATRLESSVRNLRGQLDERFGFEHVLGRSPSLRAALRSASRVASTESTVLITGESGTGKELVARAIHNASPRADGPFVALNCAALPEALLESELFGHEKGAFTGADKRKPGRFELAAGGTLFLDEVGEMALPVQAKILRVLQEREFQRVGGTETLRADVRILTATNRDLDAAVEDGTFRGDLLYRLNVFPVHLPPLRERGDDVLLLADHFVRTLEARMGKGVPGLSREARDALLAYDWPGNLRELQNAIERALIVNDGGLIRAEDLGVRPRGAAPSRRPAPTAAADDAAPSGESAAPPTDGLSMDAAERRLVEDALRRAGGNRSKAAEILGISRSKLYTRLRRHGL